MKTRFAILAVGAALAWITLFQISSCSDDPALSPEAPGQVLIRVLQPPAPSPVAPVPGREGESGPAAEGKEPGLPGPEVVPRVDADDQVFVRIAEGFGTDIASGALTFNSGTSAFEGSFTVSAGTNRIVIVEVRDQGQSDLYQFGMTPGVDVTAGKTTPVTVTLGSMNPTGFNPQSGSNPGEVDITWNALTIGNVSANRVVYTVREFRNGSGTPRATIAVVGETELQRSDLPTGTYQYTIQSEIEYAGDSTVTGTGSALAPSPTPLAVDFDAAVVDSISPPSARVGDVVTVHGDFLNRGAPQVLFAGGVFGAVQGGGTRTQFDVEIPLGAETGNVTVTNNVGSDTEAFIVDPVVLDFSPKFGKDGDQVVITGYNLEGTTDTDVFVGGQEWSTTPANATITPTQITIEADERSNSAPIVVRVNNGGTLSTATSTDVFVVLRLPNVQSVTPSEAIAGKTQILISGTDLVAAGLEITIGGVLAEADSLVDDPASGAVDQVFVTVPPGATGQGVRLENVGGFDEDLSNPTVFPAPVLSGFTPPSIPDSTATSLTLFGVFQDSSPGNYLVGFRTRVDSVTINRTFVSASSNTATQMSVTTPVPTVTTPIWLVLTVGSSADTVASTDSLVVTP